MFRAFCTAEVNAAERALAAGFERYSRDSWSDLVRKQFLRRLLRVLQHAVGQHAKIKCGHHADARAPVPSPNGTGVTGTSLRDSRMYITTIMRR